MTEPATTEAAPAVTSESAPASAAPVPAATNAADFLGGLQNAESREWVQSKGYKDFDTIVSDARFADKLKAELGDVKSKALTPPAPDAKPEEWQAFYQKLGRPENPEAYEFDMPKDLPEGLPYDGESAKAFKSWAHEAGLSPRQAQQIHDKFVGHQSGAFATAIKAAEQQADASHSELVKAWGAADSEGFKANVQSADLFIRNNGGEALLAELKSKGLLAPNGAVLSPVLAQAMAKAGKAYSEDGFVSGGVPTSRQSLEKRLFPNG